MCDCWWIFLCYRLFACFLNYYPNTVLSCGWVSTSIFVEQKTLKTQKELLNLCFIWTTIDHQNLIFTVRAFNNMFMCIGDKKLTKGQHAKSRNIGKSVTNPSIIFYVTAYSLFQTTESKMKRNKTCLLFSEMNTYKLKWIAHKLALW